MTKLNVTEYIIKVSQYSLKQPLGIKVGEIGEPHFTQAFGLKMKKLTMLIMFLPVSSLNSSPIQVRKSFCKLIPSGFLNVRICCFSHRFLLCLQMKRWVYEKLNTYRLSKMKDLKITDSCLQRATCSSLLCSGKTDGAA